MPDQQLPRASGQVGPRSFRKKPVVIAAIEVRSDNVEEVCAFTGLTDEAYRFEVLDEDTDRWSGVAIDTLEGVMIANPGDWIIRGVAGEFYPCKPDIFAATYEEVDPDAE